jgi:predicted ferric reductase
MQQEISRGRQYAAHPAERRDQHTRRRPLPGYGAIDVERQRPAGRATTRKVTAWIVRLVALANIGIVVWLWLNGGGISAVHDWGTFYTSAGRITGLLAMDALLIQVLLIARLPFLELIAGFDRLAAWHRLNGKLTLYLILAHVGFITAGYAAMDRISIPAEYLTFLQQYNGMIAATVGTVLLVLVAVTSIVIVRRRLRYETWFLVHFMAYAGIALSWFHQIPSGNEFVTNPLAAAYWTALYVATLLFVILFRAGKPLLRAVWHDLRVAAVVEEGPGVVSLHITGRHVDWLNARAGQFFLWRFLDRERWREAHPFSLSAAPNGRSLRITVKGLGDFTNRMHEIKPGTRVVAEGPFGSFTDEARTRERVALIAGGVGITPIRALLEEMDGNLALIYRVVREGDLIFRGELEALARRRHIALHFVTGDHRTLGNEHLLSAAHLRTLLPDIARREVYLCGPPAMMKALERNVRRAGVDRRHIHVDRFAL